MNKDNYTNKEKTIVNDSKQNSNIIRIVKVILVVCVICFLMPFATVSCSHMECTASGIELASGVFGESVTNMTNGNKIPLNIFVAISLVSTIVAFVIVMTKKEKKLATVLSVVSAVCLILFMITFKTYYKFSEEDMRYISVDYHFSLWAIIILHGVSAVLLSSNKKTVDNAYNNTVKIVDKEVEQLKSLYDKYHNDRAEKRKKATTIEGKEDVKPESVINHIKNSAEKIKDETTPTKETTSDEIYPGEKLVIDNLDEEIKVINEERECVEKNSVVDVESEESFDPTTIKEESSGSRLKSTMRTTTTETPNEETDRFKPAGDL